MALSMEEQRILTQIEVRLSEDDPRLAHRLSALGNGARRRRVRLIAAVAVAAIGIATVVAAVITTVT